MNVEEISRLLQNSGIRVLNTDVRSIYIEDPSCVLRGFETFLTYAWVIIIFLTGVLLFGWAVSLIRGAEHGVKNTAINIRNLFMMFAGLSMVGVGMNVVYNGDVFGVGCKQIVVSIDELNQLLDARHRKMSGRPNDLYEEFQIYDSGIVESIQMENY